MFFECDLLLLPILHGEVAAKPTEGSLAERSDPSGPAGHLPMKNGEEN
jgi:hypothetical protein